MVSEQKILYDIFNTQFAFMKMGKKSSNYKHLYECCEDLWHMMCQKTGGQERNGNKKDISFSNLERLMSEICIEALVLYCNGELHRLAQEEENEGY